jgi:hypothetical protein
MSHFQGVKRAWESQWANQSSGPSASKICPVLRPRCSWPYQKPLKPLGGLFLVKLVMCPSPEGLWSLLPNEGLRDSIGAEWDDCCLLDDAHVACANWYSSHPTDSHARFWLFPWLLPSWPHCSLPCWQHWLNRAAIRGALLKTEQLPLQKSSTDQLCWWSVCMWEGSCLPWRLLFWWKSSLF